MKLSELGERMGATLHGDGGLEITGVAALDDATPGTLTFLADAKLVARLETTRASAVVLAPDGPAVGIPSLRVADPYRAFVQAIEIFHPVRRPTAGVHPTAVVAASARVGAGAAIGAHVVLGEQVTIGPRATLHPNVTIYERARIGADFVAHAGAVVREDVEIGDRVTLHAGAVIGSDGFGYLVLDGMPHKIPQIGTVVLEDDVEVGANATVDRAALQVTRVGRGAKIDNLVMVSHNCEVGPGCILAGQVGLAGSTRLGARVMMGGQAGASGHLTIGEGAMIAAQTGIHKDMPGGEAYGGAIPPQPIREWRRMATSMARLPDVLKRLRRVEQALGLREQRREDG